MFTTDSVLAADIGGTKCLLAVCAPDGTVHRSERYESRDFRELADVVRRFRQELGGALPARAAFAIAGPVVGDVCQTTNLPWRVDARVLERELGFAKVALINDFTAQALAVQVLGDHEKVLIHPGPAVPTGPIAILGAGTGLGEAFLVWAGGYVVLPSEGGHTDFAPVDDRQLELLRYLRERLVGRVSYERVLCGRGLADLYAFLRDRGYGKERAATRELMDQEDPAAVVSRLALSGEDPLCDAALELFCEVYGQEAGNLALKVLASGGVYIVGGIAPRILERLRSGPFQRRYLDKGRMSVLVEKIPVWVVTHPASGLLGAAICATSLSL